MDCYAAKREGIEGAIAATEVDIANAEATLLDAHVLRTNLEEYEVTSLHIGTHVASCMVCLLTLDNIMHTK